MNKQDIIISLLKEIDKNIDNVNDSGGINANLKELIITDNGEYLPANYDADGFSKVIAKFDTSSLLKVKVSSLKVSNDCINENGYWYGEGLVDVSSATSFNELFYNCSNLRYVDVSNWNTSNVTIVNRLFQNCSQLQQLDLSNWDTHNVKNILYPFAGCSQLQQLNVSTWTVSDVGSISSCFDGCSQLQQLDLSNWTINNVMDISGVFTGCKQLQQLNISNWDVSSVTNMRRLFNDCFNLINIDVSTWETSKVTDMGSLFSGCLIIKNIDTSNWNTENVKIMDDMFYRDKELQQLDFSNWNVSNLTTAYRFVDGCVALSSIIGNSTIDDVLINNICALNGLKIFLSLNHTILDRASLRALINGLADLTGQDAQTLNLGTTLIAKLTEEDIAIATAKNWTIA